MARAPGLFQRRTGRRSVSAKEAPPGSVRLACHDYGRGTSGCPRPRGAALGPPRRRTRPQTFLQRAPTIRSSWPLLGQRGVQGRYPWRLNATLCGGRPAIRLYFWCTSLPTWSMVGLLAVKPPRPRLPTWHSATAGETDLLIPYGTFTDQGMTIPPSVAARP